MSWTVDRLRALKPGETFRYYCGDLSADLARCQGEAPGAQILLSNIRKAACDLEEQGRIVIKKTSRQCPADKDGPAYFVIDYFAIGIEAKS